MPADQLKPWAGNGPSLDHRSRTSEVVKCIASLQAELCEIKDVGFEAAFVRRLTSTHTLSGFLDKLR
jgi:hypothetical protein